MLDELLEEVVGGVTADEQDVDMMNSMRLGYLNSTILNKSTFTPSCSLIGLSHSLSRYKLKFSPDKVIK